jgi:hypothetical protein
MIISQWLGFLLVLIYGWHRSGRVDPTFVILLIASIINGFTNISLTEENPFLLVAYSYIDTATIGMVIAFGGTQRAYQGWLLGAAAVSHLLCHIDEVYGYNLIYDVYLESIVAITLMQLIGGCYGMAQRTRPANNASS